MRTVNVALGANSYNIVIGRDILCRLGARLKKMDIGRDAVIITNPVIKRYHGDAIVSGLKQSGFTVKWISVPSGEESKTAGMAFSLIEKIAGYDKLKRIFIIALGGGVIGDLAGYVAAVYKRGVPYVQVPTTFLAQIDSAIGGKVAVDLPVGKNLIGAFYQPRLVFSDVSVLSTLSKRQIRNGASEAVKYGVISDRDLFDYIEVNYKRLLALSPVELSKVIYACSKIKADVVASDERETKGVRTILNFGHTIGHAIEAASEYGIYNHGEAVALGMRAAVDISVSIGMTNKQQAQRLNNLLTLIGLPHTIKGISFRRIIDVMKHDKKFIRGKNRFVLMKKIGCVKVVEGISEDIIRKAVLNLMADRSYQ